MRMITKANLLPEARLEQLIDEAEQLRRIVGQSINTADRNRRKGKL